MPVSSPSTSRLPQVLALLSCALIAACGGGGGGAGSGATVGSEAPAASGSATSASSPASSAATSTATTQHVDIADAVAAVSALGVSATLSLGLPGVPASAPALATTPSRVFHVDSANGTDSNDGMSEITSGGSGPWRTLARLKTAGLAAGDRVELACGGVWHETLSLPVDGTAGAPIVVSTPAAGCSSLPSIDGTTSLGPSAWTAFKGSIYTASLAAVPLNLFSSSGLLTIAHFPSNADVAADPGSPYLALAADSSANVLTTGSDFVLPAGATIDSTTHVHVRTNPYIIDESAVGAFDGTRITLARAPTYPVHSGWGYFLTGQLWMLRSAGQWWYDPAAAQLYAWMPDSAAPSTAVAVSTLAVGIDLQGRNHVVVDGLAVHGVGVGVDARGSTDVTLRNMLIEDIADFGIDVAGSSHDVVESNGVARTGGDAITGWGGAMSPLVNDSTALTARNNIIRDSGVRMLGEQVLSLPRRSLAALFIGNGSTATGNVIVNAGYIGILAQTDSIVEGNFVYGACSVQDDCGGIYTSGTYNRSRIVGNTVVHSRGSLFGQPMDSRETSAEGIYLDDKGSDVVIQGNTVIDTDFGILLHDASRTSVDSNRLFGNRRAQIWMQEDTREIVANGDMVDNVVSGNQVAPIAPAAVGFLLSTTFASTANFATFSSNHFYDRMSPTVVRDTTGQGSQALTFAAWSGSTGHGSTQPVDPDGSAVSASGLATYTPVGGNLVPNGSLQSDSSGWAGWNATAPAGQMTRTTCPVGICLQYVAGGSQGVLSSPGFALQQGAWYRLTIDTSTQIDDQRVPLIVRLGSGDYASVSDRNLTFWANRAWGRHSVVFQSTRTVAAAGARVDIDGIVAGQSISIAALELVQIEPDSVAQNSSVIVNAAATPLSAACPFSATQPALCSQLFDLASGQNISWPLVVPARSAAILYAQNLSLADSDNDGIPDNQDSCANTPAGMAVNAAGCPLTTH